MTQYKIFPNTEKHLIKAATTVIPIIWFRLRPLRKSTVSTSTGTRPLIDRGDYTMFPQVDVILQVPGIHIVTIRRIRTVAGRTLGIQRVPVDRRCRRHLAFLTHKIQNHTHNKPKTNQNFFTKNTALQFLHWKKNFFSIEDNY